MGAFVLNNKAGFAFVALIVLSIVFALSRMPGGIGGTGIDGGPGGIGGTGIYGRIDAFGSIWVNGVEIFYDDEQNIVRQGRDGLTDRLAIGQIVAVTIDEEAGRAEARTIEIVEEVNGPIERLAPDQFVILGQRVLLTDETIIDRGLEEGRQVAVNGLRSGDGLIIASRIGAPLIEGEFSLRGTVERVEAETFWVGDQEILLGDRQVRVGYEVDIRGRLDITRTDQPVFVSEAFEADLDTLFDDTVTRRHYQKIVEQNSAFDFGGYDIDHIQIKDYNIATIEVEFQNNNNDFKRINEQVKDVRPLIRERRIKSRIDAQRVDEKIVMETRQAADIDTTGEQNVPLAQEVLDGTIGQSPNNQMPMASLPRIDQEVRSRTIIADHVERVNSRRIELQKSRLAAANVRRLAAVEVRKQAITQARKHSQTEAQSAPQGAFEPHELEEILRENNINRKTYEQIQRSIRDRVAREIREGARYEARDEVRRRIREEIRRRIRRQLRSQ